MFKNLILNLKSFLPIFYTSVYKNNGINILDIDSTIDLIISKKISVSRFGDGEISIMTNKHGVGFQEKDETLAYKLYTTLISSNPFLLICLPDQLNNINNSVRKTRKFWMAFLQNHQHFLLHNLKKNKIYGNSHITRFYITSKDKAKANYRFKKLKKLWEGVEILLVEGEFTRSGIGNNLFSNCLNIQRIICPAKNAFTLYDEILRNIIFHGNNKLILLSLGPTATILAHDLSEMGFWALDLGHIDVEYMWMVNNAKVKTNLKGKYVNEMNANLYIEELDEAEMVTYQKQIVCKVLI